MANVISMVSGFCALVGVLMLAITTKQNEKAIKLIEKLNFIKIADLDDNEVEYELRQDINLKD